jgi:hypothetical protein
VNSDEKLDKPKKSRVKTGEVDEKCEKGEI